eukprot:13546058-Ditylum_brightwellii.AAC.1
MGIQTLPKNLIKLLDFYQVSRILMYDKVDKRAWSNSTRQAYSKHTYLYNKIVQCSKTIGKDWYSKDEKLSAAAK